MKRKRERNNSIQDNVSKKGRKASENVSGEYVSKRGKSLQRGASALVSRNRERTQASAGSQAHVSTGKGCGCQWDGRASAEGTHVSRKALRQRGGQERQREGRAFRKESERGKTQLTARGEVRDGRRFFRSAGVGRRRQKKNPPCNFLTV